MIEENSYPNHIKLSPFPVYLGAFCNALFCVFAFFSWRAGTGYLPLLFLGFIPVGVFLILARGSIAFDEKSIYYRIFFSSYKMDWADVRLVETDHAGIAIVFIGENKHIAIMGPGYWASKGRAEFTEKLLQKLEKQNLKIRVTGKAGFRRTGKNTKIK